MLGGVVGWPLVGSVLSGWVLLVVIGVGDICIIGLVSGLLVGGWLEGVLVWCGFGVGEITLSVQDLVCDGCRWVAVDRDSGRVLSGGWRGCVSLGLAFCEPLVCVVGWWW